MCNKNSNYFDQFTWPEILHLYPESSWDIKAYHQILCRGDYPDFLDKYIQLPIMQRLSGVGLLCGSDWTKLFHNRFFYSRLDHSIGVALIIWNFTHDKAQTLAGLFHDVSTPTFSHVSDFRKGDALTQTITEEDNSSLVRKDLTLTKLLEEDGIKVEQVENYHIYPVADNEIPQLSADRLEYMFPSGAVLEGSWNLEEIEKTYRDIVVLKNESNQDELAFKSLEIAQNYCKKFCMTGHLLQMNEDKMTLHLLGQIMNRAVEEGLLQEEDFMQLSESQIIEKIDNKGSQNFQKLYKTFRNMECILHSDIELPEDEYFNLSLKVKLRYINPLVKTESGVKRLNECSNVSKSLIDDFLHWEDKKFGSVKYYSEK
ncbi:MAG: hypothetical protein K5866_03170 [Treponema sp.]|nr:hypothetical protein [Treponema sp.]